MFSGILARAETIQTIRFADIPSLTNGPGKGCYALYQGKMFEVQVLTNLDCLVYPVDVGKRSERPIRINNGFVTGWCGLTFIGLVKPEPPSMNPSKLVFRVVTDKGEQLLQTWKFSDGTLSVNNHFKEVATTMPDMKMAVIFPKTHTFKADESPEVVAAATAGYTLRWRAGRADNAMKISTVPYDSRVLLQNCCDWMEHKGPWGNRKVTVKRTTNKGTFSLAGSVYGYEGAFLIFTTGFGAQKRSEIQGFDLKVE